jgi:hypothetical protein
MGIVALVAAVFSVARHHLWVLGAAAFFLYLTLLFLAPFRASRLKGPLRAFWIGFALVGWGYAIVLYQNSGSVLLWCPDIPTGSWLDELFLAFFGPPRAGEGNSVFLHGPPEYLIFHSVGQCLLGMTFAFLGGVLSFSACRVGRSAHSS